MPFILAFMAATAVFAIEKGQTLKVQHGDMKVVYTLEDHHHYLKVLKKTDIEVKGHQGKEIFKLMQKLDLKLQEKELLSIDKSFECYDKNNIYSYGVITKKIAREKTPFPPLRAWSVNEKDFKLEKVENPYTVKCKFKKGEESDYPFPPE